VSTLLPADAMKKSRCGGSLDGVDFKAYQRRAAYPPRRVDKQGWYTLKSTPSSDPPHRLFFLASAGSRVDTGRSCLFIRLQDRGKVSRCATIDMKQGQESGMGRRHDCAREGRKMELMDARAPR
jgi:hypothetical protein